MQGQQLFFTVALLSPFSDNKDVSVMMSEMDVNAIAGTLKLYFRELPEPLFTDELYPNFAEGIGRCSKGAPVMEAALKASQTRI